MTEVEAARIDLDLLRMERAFDGLGFCLSETGDLLSQWRAYSNNGQGFAIGFREEGLRQLAKRYTPDNKKLLSLEKVICDESDQIADIRPLCIRLVEYSRANPHWRREGTNNIREAVGPAGSTPTELDKRRAEVNIQFSTASLHLISNFFTFKSESFREEREWRLLSLVGGSPTEPVEYLARPNRLVPFRTLSFAGLEDSLLSNVILGPRNETQQHQVKFCLERLGYTRAAVNTSAAPYR